MKEPKYRIEKTIKEHLKAKGISKLPPDVYKAILKDIGDYCEESIKKRITNEYLGRMFVLGISDKENSVK